MNITYLNFLAVAKTIVKHYRDQAPEGCDPQNTWVAVGVTVVGGVAGYVGNQSTNKSNQAAINAQYGIVGDQTSANQDLLDQYMSFLQDSQDQFNEKASGIISAERALVDTGRDANNNYINNAYSNINDLIRNIPGISALMGEAESLTTQDFDYRTAIKRQNLAFVTGNTEPQIRDAQSMNAGLAALDPSSFVGKMGDIFKSSTLGLKATTLGEPTGSFANLSAQNLYNFSNQGLSNYLSISDFFSREGTVDPLSPLQTAFDLRTVAENTAKLSIGNEQWNAGSLVDVNNAYINQNIGISAQEMGVAGELLNQQTSLASLGLNAGMGINNTNASNLINLSNAGIAANATSNSANNQLIGSIASGIAGAYTNSQNRQALNTQNDYYKSMSSYLNSNSKFGSVGYSSSANTNPSNFTF